MGKTIEAIYENSVFRSLRPVSLAEGERVKVTVPDDAEQVRRRLEALDAFEESFGDLTEEQWKLFDQAVERRPLFANRRLGRLPTG